ncbi:MAG TPA: peptidase M19 [Hellea balneolensis]|uniref:Peptidase M19 n=1 Tax=Hellea balneolensis TaxID=287478 RepID=A0A7C3C4H2_9PROT|nr:peptidase M19 [Hellea balneolensis]
MKKPAKIILGLIILALIGGYLFAFHVLPGKMDGKMNFVTPHDPYPVSQDAKDLHKTLRLADLHADTLLWKRDPSVRHSRGRTDFPRLREGGFALQVFSTVTAVPEDLNETENSLDTDQMVKLTFLQKWPKRTHHSIYERALYQAQRLHKAEAASNGNFVIAKTKADLANALAARETNADILIGVLAMEGAHPLEGKLGNIDKLYNAGFRMMGLQHFFDNELGGSLHGVTKSGLTPFGKKAVRAALAKGMMIDVAHSSVKVVEDVLALTDAPIVISHTGIVTLCNNPKRNIPIELMQEIAGRGGLIGVGYWEMAVCDPSPDGIAKMLIHGAETLGVEHIALGSDFDGAVKTNIDATELNAVTDALLRQGMSEADIAKVMGENQIAYFLKHLPGE